MQSVWIRIVAIIAGGVAVLGFTQCTSMPRQAATGVVAVSTQNGPATLPAFLDAPDRVRFAFDGPVKPGDPKDYEVVVGSKIINAVRVEGVGKPIRPRVAPRREGRVVLPGTLQSALGEGEWDPDGESTLMTEVSPGIHELVVALPKGRYEFKIARNGSWSENYGRGFEPGGTNMSIVVPADGTIVKFVVDFKAKTILDSINNSDKVTPPKTVGKKTEGPREADSFASLEVTLERAVPLNQLHAELEFRVKGEARRLYARDVLNHPDLQYDETDLGSRWTKTSTTFRVWSPVSSRADVLLYDAATGGTARVVPMERSERGTWKATMEGDLHGKYYLYRFQSYGEERITQDIESRAANKDSTRSMVIDLTRTQPNGWPSRPKLTHKNPTDAILYEISVRDFTSLPGSGVRPEWMGKYLGLAQEGTKDPVTGEATGLNHLVKLGVTDIHVLPAQNFLLSHEGDYSWGYATNLFNVPEESYSTNPNDPITVIREFKTMVAALHKNGLRLVMDVVYNHTWPPQGKDSAFWQTVPYYYFRTNDLGAVLNESGVGNAWADERPMARKYVRDSLVYWAQEYGVDGFRFDLVGMHQPQSVRDWVKAIRAVRPDAVLYGEPWTGGGPTYFPKGAQRGTGMAVFNDHFRNVFRGELDGPGKGFATGGSVSVDALRAAIEGSTSDFTDAPVETINYVSAHDNMTLLDKVALTMPKATKDAQQSAVRLATAAVLLSQGVAFLEGGVEIGRTKGGNRNSYDAGDRVNGYDWKRAREFTRLNRYVQGLVAIRRAHPAFRMADRQTVSSALKFLPGTNENQAVFELDGSRVGDSWGRIVVILNGSESTSAVELASGDWNVAVEGDKAQNGVIRSVRGGVNVAPLSVMVLWRR
ncbi:MAG: type I pullulanase [Chthonomonas sp.]|nr:type I pullulanase [Chthonomonas sp.]